VRLEPYELWVAGAAGSATAYPSFFGDSRHWYAIGASDKIVAMTHTHGRTPGGVAA